MTLPAYAMNVSSFPELYERWLVGPLFVPFAEALVDRLAPAPGDRVVDLACGTGIVARLAHQRLAGQGQVIAVDVSPHMLAVGRAIEPGIDWREGNASALPVDSASVEILFCHQGFQFFPDKLDAAREMRRVLVPDGRLGLATWRPLEESPVFREVDALAERHLGPLVDSRFGFAVAADIRNVLEEGGFRDVRVETVTRRIRFNDVAVFLQLNANACVGMSAAGKAMSDEERQRLAALITNESTDVARAYGDGDGIAFDLGTNLATARA